MAREEIWISDISSVQIDGDCVRTEFLSGRKRLIVHGRRQTLFKALQMGGEAIQALHPSAGVVKLPNRNRRIKI